MPFLVLLLALSLAEAEPPLPSMDGYTAVEAAKFGAWAGLRPLATGQGRQELRVWSSAGILGIVDGYVVTRDRIEIYSNGITVDGVTQASDTMRRVASKSRREARQIQKLFAQFSDLDDKAVTCGVRDGVGFTIEGNLGGGYFSFYAGNPRRCDTPLAQKIARAIEDLYEVAGSRAN